MRKEYVLTSVVSVVIGAGLMLLAVGGSKPAGIEGWVPLNAEVASALQAEKASAGAGGGAASSVAKAGGAGKADQSGAMQGMETAGGGVAAGGADGATATGAAASSGAGAASEKAGEPTAGNPATGNATASNPNPGEQAAGAAAASTVGSTASFAAPQQQVDTSLISINQAGLTELQDIPGIGEKKAQAIIDYRTAHGPFAALSDLTKVKGIGDKMLEKMKPYIRL